MMSKEENWEETPEEETPVASARLGKEAKIGVMVIGALAVVLGGAVVYRLCGGSSAAEKSAVAAEQNGGQEQPRHEKRAEMHHREMPPPPKPVAVAPATVVPTAPPPIPPPKPAMPDNERWKHATARAEQRRPGGEVALLGAPPLVVSDPPPTPRSDRRDRYAIDRMAKRDIEAAPALPGYQDRSHYEPPLPPPRSETPYPSAAERPGPPPDMARFDRSEARRDFGRPMRGGDQLRRPLPAPRRDDGKYEVQPNDSYWTISERLYGMGVYFKALAQHNRGKNEGDERLQPGQLILAPTLAELEKSYPDLCPKPSRREAIESQSQSRASLVSGRGSYRGGRTYTVVEGDTLFNIARYELGKASRWAEIYDLNRDVLGKDFNYLRPGIQLTLPDGQKSDVIAQPAGDARWR
jgi:nucleoid-associated protein YgaU